MAILTLYFKRGRMGVITFFILDVINLQIRSPRKCETINTAIYFVQYSDWIVKSFITFFAIVDKINF